MKTLIAGVLGFGLSATLLLACTPCYQGVSVYDGQTAVPLDAPLAIDLGDPIYNDLPAISGHVGLFHANGTPVNAVVSLDEALSRITITPAAPLLPDHDYQIRSLLEEDFASATYDPSWTYRGHLVDFYTGTRPALLKVWRTGDTLLLLTSEPVPTASLLAGILLRDASGVPIEWANFTVSQPHPAFAWITLPEVSHPVTVQPQGDVLAQSPAIEAVTTGNLNDYVAFIEGQPTCLEDL